MFKKFVTLILLVASVVSCAPDGMAQGKIVTLVDENGDGTTSTSYEVLSDEVSITIGDQVCTVRDFVSDPLSTDRLYDAVQSGQFLITCTDKPAEPKIEPLPKDPVKKPVVPTACASKYHFQGKKLEKGGYSSEPMVITQAEVDEMKETIKGTSLEGSSIEKILELISFNKPKCDLFSGQACHYKSPTVDNDKATCVSRKGEYDDIENIAGTKDKKTYDGHYIIWVYKEVTVKGTDGKDVKKAVLDFEHNEKEGKYTIKIHENRCDYTCVDCKPDAEAAVIK